MKKLIGVLIIIVLLITGGILEEIFINKTTDKLVYYSSNLETLFKDNQENINTPEINEEFSKLKIFWDETEDVLCYITNFEKIRTLDENITKLESAIKYNDFSVASENLALIKNYKEVLHYVLGANIDNVL